MTNVHFSFYDVNKNIILCVYNQGKDLTVLRYNYQVSIANFIMSKSKILFRELNQ